MDIKQCIKIELTESDLKKIVLEFVKKEGYRVNLNDINFDVGTVWHGYGMGEFEETVLKGCTIKCSGLGKENQYE